MKPSKHLKKNQERLQRALIIAALLLATSSTVAGQGFPLQIGELGNIVAQPCSSNSFMNDLQRALQSFPAAQGTNIVAIYLPQVKGSEQYCTQSTQISSGFSFFTGSTPPAVHMTLEVRDNRQSILSYSGHDYTDCRLPGQLTMDQLRNLILDTSSNNGAPPPQGVFLFLLNKGAKSVYASFTFGGFFACDQTCQTCSGPQNNQCTSCNPSTPVQGASINAGLSGRCLCANGAIDNAGTGCQKSKCHKSCGGCHGPGASRCFSCADGYEVVQPLQDGLHKCKRLPRPAEGGNPAQDFACHITCDTCRGVRQDHCTKCADLSEKVNLSLDAGECRCPKGKYLTADEDACADCHSSCSKCSGPGSDQCVTCTDHQGIPIRAAGAKAGTCFNCGDPVLPSLTPLSATER